MTVAPTKAPTPTDLLTSSPTTTPTLSPKQVVREIEAVLDPDTVDTLVEGVSTVLESVTTESDTPRADSIVVNTVTLSHEVATLTQEELDEVKAGLSIVLDFSNGNVATRRYLQAGSGLLELIAVGDATIVPCPEDEMDPCVGTASEVMFSTMPITITTSAPTPTVKSGKGSKSGGSNSGGSKSGKISKGTSSPTVPGVTMPSTMKSGKGGKGRMRI
jgi:hypothetical protein